MTVALWTWHYYSLHFDIYDTETEAAEDALTTEETGTGSVAGIQRPDGTVVPREEWDEYQRASERRNRRWEREVEQSLLAAQLKGKPKLRKIRAPFNNGQGAPYIMDVLADTPEWIGQPSP